MRFKIYIIFSFLIIALLIQNTCPHGFAGKSSVAMSCSQCLQKQAHKAAFDATTLSSIAKAPAHLPMFVLDMPGTKPAFRFAVTTIPQPIIPNTYRNAAPKGLLQPPRA